MRPERSLAASIVAVALVCAAGAANAQTDAAPARVSFTNLIEAQFGNDPFASFLGSPKNATSTYEQLNGEVAWQGLALGFRFESQDDSQQESTYQRITQRYADWRQDHVRVRVGNFYTILGRGLALRSFELPGVVLQQSGSRARTAFSREQDGVLVEGEWGPASARAFSSNDAAGTLSGGQAQIDAWRGSQVGATYVRAGNPIGTLSQEVGSGYVQLDPLALAGVKSVALPVYAEYAQLDRSFGEWWSVRTGDRAPHALYVSTELVCGPFAGSAEWKDYRGFRLGYNDPPSLVREHSYVLPNRATHVLDAESEHGVQLEGTWRAERWGSLTLNHSRSAGTPSGRAVRFEENYAELHVAPERASSLEWNAFYARGHDEFNFVRSREIYGTNATIRFLGPWSSSLDVQRLDAVRQNVFVPNDGWSDWYASVQIARSSWGSAAYVWQRTTDPLEEDPDLFGGPIDPRVYRAVNVSLLLGRAHSLSVFAGQRRGGPACTAGTCYEVMPFEGAEVRMISRF